MGIFVFWSHLTVLQHTSLLYFRPKAVFSIVSSIYFIDFITYGAQPQQLQWQSTLEHRFQPADRHDVVSGLGYQLGYDKFNGTTARGFEPDSKSYHFLSVFSQDEISFLDGEARLILGTKLSHNSFTGFEYQPNIRAAWTPKKDVTLWSAVSRAVRTPSRGEQNARVTTGLLPATEQTQGLPILAVARGSRDVEAVNLTAYEVGARTQLTENFSIDVAAFVNDYRDVVSAEFSSATPNLDPDLPRVDVVTTFANELSALSHGVEVVLDYRPSPIWKLTGSYAFVDVRVWGSNSSDQCDGGEFSTPFFCKFEDANADHIVSLRSLYNVSSTVSFDAFLQYVTGWSVPVLNDDVDDYMVLDVRLAWNALEGLELALVGQNLIEENHEEWEQNGAFGGENARIPRSVYAQMSYAFN